MKGNKGELSELYTFFKLLADGRLYGADGNLQKYDNIYYPILKIFRNDAPDRNEYAVDALHSQILVAGQNVSLTISQQQFREQSDKLLALIKNLKNSDPSAFDEIENFMNKIDCGGVKAKSTDKADIRIVIHNLNTGTEPEYGYSIKSKLGAKSTLINSNVDGSNFIYKIIGIEDVLAINNIVSQRGTKEMMDLKGRIKYVTEHGGHLEFVDTAAPNLRNNLTMLDTCMPRLVALMLLESYLGESKRIPDITKAIIEKNPLNFDLSAGMKMYEYKVKHFLLSFALGMTASTAWNGKYNANGGFIVVKEDGDIVCYHYFDRNDLENYLFYNTQFETPDPGRHKFGNVFQQNGEFFIKLNMQVRFI
jgi:hypothetical protein